MLPQVGEIMEDFSLLANISHSFMTGLILENEIAFSLEVGGGGVT